jgi:hypothetical protein
MMMMMMMMIMMINFISNQYGISCNYKDLQNLNELINNNTAEGFPLHPNIANREKVYIENVTIFRLS